MERHGVADHLGQLKRRPLIGINEPAGTAQEG